MFSSSCIYQVVRGRLAWDAAGNPPARPTMQVMYDVPLNTTDEPLAEIKQEAPADILPDLDAPSYSIQILSSEDGIDWVHAVLYPASWSKKEATERAVEALTEAQKADPENWDWDDLVPELKAHGFTIADWHRGPNWDKQRVPIPEEE